MKRKDQFFGEVIRVSDGDTVIVNVQSRRSSNRYPYGGEERVRLYGVNTPELDTAAGRRSSASAKRAFLGRRVAVTVQTRDKFNRVVGHVQVER